QLVEELAGATIPQLWAEGGEACFRRWERLAIRQACGRRGAVIATGGGAVLDPRNWEEMRREGLVVALTASPEVLAARLGRGEGRPLLAGGDPRAAIEELLARRAPLYAQADVVVDTTGRRPDEVAEEIVARWNREWPGVRRVWVELGPRSYPIYIGEGLLPRLGELVRVHCPARRCLVVADQTVASLYGHSALAALQEAGLEASLATFPAGEESKSLAVANRLYEVALDYGLARDEAIVALGGGVTGDLAGYVAATYLRGVSYLQVPTTLLAQVDSSVGGKVGVNHPRGKNLIGAFYQPNLVVCAVDLLASLPAREVRNGLAEVIKYGVIADPPLFALLEEELPALLALEKGLLAEVVARSCAIKARVVRRDEREEGERASLNFGHTLGHALEAVSGYTLLCHGEAVAAGMAGAAWLAWQMGLAAEELYRRLLSLLERAGLPTSVPGLDPREVEQRLRLDKKVRAGRVRFVLPRRLGEVTVEAVPEELVRQAVELVTPPLGGGSAAEAERG
ncbi:MAG: 3-dehydroquinate synthase, partial [Bacillota bacterium]|nr:3-dehydroquinate synthase [Bacillota bacterium]